MHVRLVEMVYREEVCSLPCTCSYLPETAKDNSLTTSTLERPIDEQILFLSSQLRPSYYYEYPTIFVLWKE